MCKGKRDPRRQQQGLVQGQGSIGTLAVAQSGQSATAPGLSGLPTTTDASLNAPISGGIVLAALTTSSRPDQILGLSDGFNERVPTGPFASRSANALGPSIAASMQDPTSPVDRHERALLQDLEGIGIEDETVTPVLLGDLVNATGQRSLPIEAEPRSSETNEDNSLVVVVSGRGGFPLKVTARPGGQRADLTALLAALPDSSGSNSEIPAASSEDLALDEFSVALAALSTSPTDRSEFPDYVKAACGLIMGLGLTSGPLFPDLMQSLRSRVPQWFIGRRARGRRGNGLDSTV